MRFFLLLLALLGPLAARPAAAQSAADTLRAAVGPLRGFDAERRRLDQRGLLVLGGWAAGRRATCWSAASPRAKPTAQPTTSTK